MAPPLLPGEPGGHDLEAELEAERAATEHWRRLAEQRSAELAAVRHRPIVRAVLSLERRLGPARAQARAAAARIRPVAHRAVLAVSAAGHRPHHGPDDVADAIRSLPAPDRDGRRVTLVVVGPAGAVPGLDWAAEAIETVQVQPSDDTAAAVGRVLDTSTADVVGLMLATSEPLDDTWLARLVAAVRDDVVAATPLLVHPRRPLSRATTHDGRVRSAGLALEATADGVPRVQAEGAGRDPDAKAPARTVAAATAACLLIDRGGYVRAGGLPAGDDLDVAAVELCARLEGRIVVVPSVVLVDHRPVASTRDLRGPIDPGGAAWRAAIGRSGPVLLRSVRPGRAEAHRFALTVAAPSAKVAQRWGDWHLAEGLAAGLRRLGHEVRLQTADHSDDPAGRACDVHLVLRGLRPVHRSAGQRHVLWIISHPESIDDDELDGADLVLVASSRFAAHLRTRTETPVEVLLQATDQHRFRPRPVDPAHRHAVTIVAKTRGVLRPVVADALAAGLRPTIYGGGWTELVDPRLVADEHVANEVLPIVYSSAGVVLNDHWHTMQTWGFVSNRLYDVLACGTPVISDPVPGLAAQFDGAVLEYHDPVELRALVERVLADPTAARLRAERGRAVVVAEHTFDRRAAELLAYLTELGDAG